MGIVNRLVPLSQLHDETLKIAKLIAAGDGYLLWMTKRMINGAQDAAGLDVHMRAGLDTWTAYRRDVRVYQ